MKIHPRKRDLYKSYDDGKCIKKFNEKFLPDSSLKTKNKAFQLHRKLV